MLVYVITQSPNEDIGVLVKSTYQSSNWILHQYTNIVSKCYLLILCTYYYIQYSIPDIDIGNPARFADKKIKKYQKISKLHEWTHLLHM